MNLDNNYDSKNQGKHESVKIALKSIYLKLLKHA